MTMYRSIAGYYEQIFPLNKDAARFVVMQVPDPGIRILDVGCGTGAMARYLAKAGRTIVGIDPERDMIGEARRLAAERQVPVTFHVLGMEDLETWTDGRSFDLGLCLGNTLPHLTDATVRAGFLKSLQTRIRTGGKVIIQIVNFDRWTGAGSMTFPVLERNGFRFIRSYRQTEHPEIVTFETELTTPDGSTVSGISDLAVLKKQILEQELLKAGFDSIQVMGDFGGGPWSADSPATILTAGNPG